MAERLLVAAGRGAGLRLKRGEQLRVIDIEGGQTGDLVAFSADGKHRLSSGRTFDYGGKIYVSTGDALWSDRSEPMLTIVADDVGKHDLLYAPCSIEMYRLQYGVTEYHANCYDNLCSAFRELGIELRFRNLRGATQPRSRPQGPDDHDVRDQNGPDSIFQYG